MASARSVICCLSLSGACHRCAIPIAGVRREKMSIESRNDVFLLDRMRNGYFNFQSTCLIWSRNRLLLCVFIRSIALLPTLNISIPHLFLAEFLPTSQRWEHILPDLPSSLLSIYSELIRQPFQDSFQMMRF